MRDHHHLNHRDDGAEPRPALGDGTPLARAWNATRPAELSSAEFDRLWAGASLAADRQSPPTLAIPPRSPAWSRTGPGRAAFGLARAAAIVLLVWLVARPGRRDPVPAVDPSARGLDLASRAPAEYKVDPDETLMISIDAAGLEGDPRRLRPDTDAGAGPLAFSDALPAHNQYEVLGLLESLSAGGEGSLQ